MYSVFNFSLDCNLLFRQFSRFSLYWLMIIAPVGIGWQALLSVSVQFVVYLPLYIIRLRMRLKGNGMIHGREELFKYDSRQKTNPPPSAVFPMLCWVASVWIFNCARSWNCVNRTNRAECQTNDIFASDKRSKSFNSSLISVFCRLMTLTSSTHDCLLMSPSDFIFVFAGIDRVSTCDSCCCTFAVGVLLS